MTQEIINKNKIEGRTKEDVIKLLQNAGLGKVRRRKWTDYQEAKLILFGGQFIDSGSYDQQIGWVLDYLKL